MSIIAEDSKLIFYAEGGDAVEYLDLLDEEGEDAVVEQIVNGKLDEIDLEETPEPEDEDDEVFEDEEGHVLVYSRRFERMWLYRLPDFDDRL